MGLASAALARPAAAGAEALDLASLSRRDEVRTAAHLSHETLLLHLAAELAQGLLELLRVLDNYLQTLITPFCLLLAGPGYKAATGPSAWASRTRITEVRGQRALPGTGAGLGYALSRP